MKLPPGIRRIFRLDSIRPDAASELEDELAFHFEQTVAGLRSSGMSEAQARAEAKRRFGSEDAYRRALKRINGKSGRHREEVGVVDIMLGNLKFAVRGIRRAPGFAAAVVLILSLGIGANAVMFGVIDRLLLSPPQHVRDADAVRHVYLQRKGYNNEVEVGRTLTYPDYVDLQAAETFSWVAAYTDPMPLTMGRGAEAERVRAVMASSTLFPLLGPAPALGRFFNADEDALGAGPAVVLSEEFWARRFGSDPEILGRMLDIGGGRYEIVGVTPRGFTGAELNPVDVWLPIQRAAEIEEGGSEWWTGRNARNWWWLRVAVRIDQGADLDVAASQATALHLAGREALLVDDRYDPDARLLLAPIVAAQGPNPSSEAQVAGWLAGVSLIVLLIACFNVANLLLARAQRSRRELSIRMALGVSRGRLLGQLMTESLVLATLGALGATLLAKWGSDAIHSVLLPDIAFADGGLNARLLTFLGVATLLTAGLAGILPALQATRASVGDELRAGSRGIAAGSNRARLVLLVAQAALSVVLLVGAGLFVLSLHGARSVDLGYDGEQLVMVRLEWSETLPTDTRQQVFEDARDRVARLPGVSNASLAYTIPFYSSLGMGRPRVPGLDTVPRHPGGGPYANKVTPEYFETMGLSVLRGRGIEPADRADGAPPVAVITESMAEAYWPGQQALGQCMVWGDEEDDPPCTTVVGVMENFHRQDIREPLPEFQYVVNWSHHNLNGPAQVMMVRTIGPVEEQLLAIRREVGSTSPLIRFPQVTPLMVNVEEQLRSWRLGATMFTVFGILALVVAAIGLYSVLAFDVALRQTELGIRAALGAGASRLVSMVVRRAVALVALGTAIGMVIAVAGSSYMAPLLFDVSPRSPGVYAVVGLTLLVVAGLAGSLPAWRVARVDPTQALQAE